ncbi:MAG: VanW family protein, partial [Lachnospiraceae bacterium]
AKELYQVIGIFTTTTTANKDRNTNITIACEALDGLIIHPGEEFSFNQTTGNRTLEKGYKPAGAYVNGVLVEEPGGGVCQVSSTLYNAVIFSGLTTTERHAHSYEPSYVTPGEDAMVSYDGYSGPDMKFINKSSAAVAIRTSFVDRKLTISIVGIPILEEGVTLSMHSEKKMDLDPPEPTYEEDQTLEAGVEVVAKEAVLGSRWVTNLITKKDGVVVSDEFFHNSTYKGKAAIIKRNTSGVVIPDPSASASDGMSDGSGTDGGSLPGESSQEGDQIGPGIPTTAPETSTQAQEPGQSESSSAAESGGPGGENRQEQPQEPGSAPTVEAVDPHPMGSEE